jgi:hypothetical protein
VRDTPTTQFDADGHAGTGTAPTAGSDDKCGFLCKLGNLVTGNGWKTNDQVKQEEIKRERDWLIKQQVKINGKRKDYSKASDEEVQKDFQIVLDAYDNNRVQDQKGGTPPPIGAGGPASPNQMQKKVERGQAPKSVDRVDSPRFPNEKPHVEFKDGNALNNDGTWKHGGRALTNAEQEWLQTNGWQLPK